MNYEQEFLKDFEEWVQTQIMVNELAMNESRRVLEEDRDERAADAYIRYESKLDAYQFIQGKFANYKAGKAFHDLPDGLFGEKHYQVMERPKRSRYEKEIDVQFDQFVPGFGLAVGLWFGEEFRC